MYKSPVILIAEDDENVSMAMRSILTRKYSCDVVVVRDGKEAWEEIKRGNIDLIISDWNMPYKSGDELLVEVRNHEKSRYTPFIMLTARSDKESVLTAVNSGVSNYISKPFSKNDVLEKVSLYIDEKSGVDTSVSAPRTAGEAGSVDDTDLARTIDNYINAPGYKVPALPRIVRDIIDLVNDKKADADKLAALVAQDERLAAGLIGICNSVYFGGKEIITGVQDAVVRLGLNETQCYALMLAQESMLNKHEGPYQDLVHAYWKHAYATAACAMRIARHLKLPVPNTYFTMGLLHDIGKFLIIKLVVAFTETGAHYSEDSIIRVLSGSHEKIGGFVLKQWGFPANFIEVAKNHHMVHSGGHASSAVLVVNLSDAIVRKLGFGVHNKADIDLKNIQSARSLMLGSKDINNILLAVDDEVAKLITSV